MFNNASIHNSSKQLKELLRESMPELFTEVALMDKPLENIKITGVTDNSKQVEPGNIFVAYKGNQTDAHKYIPEAIKRGAATIILENPKNLDNNNLPYIQVKNGRKALSKLISSFYNHPSQKMTVTGITGTNGKTTVTTLIDFIYRQLDQPSGLIGTVEHKINGNPIPTKTTTPPAPELYNLLHQMNQHKVKYVTKEVSSHALKQDRVSAINFNIAGITNISKDHVDFHPTWEDYVNSKTKFFQMLSPNSMAILNADDSQAIAMGDKTRAKVITYGINSSGSMIIAENICSDHFTTSFNYHIQGEIPTTTSKVISPQTHSVSVNMPGIHNIYNTMLAITACVTAGFPPEQVIEQVSKFPGIFRRLELLHKGDFTVIDDCAHNPASLESVFSTIHKLSFKQLLILFAIRGNRGSDINLANSKTLINWVKKLPVKSTIITTCHSHAGKKNQVTHEEQMSFLSCLNKAQIPYDLNHDLQNAVHNILSKAEPGDLVLILGPYAIDSAQNIVRQYFST